MPGPATLRVLLLGLTAMWAVCLVLSIQRPGLREALEPAAIDFRINLNTAPAPRLQALPGVGPALAQRIVEHRERIGGYARIDQLQDVRGIALITRQRIEPWVSLE